MHYLLEIESVQEIKSQLEEALILLQEGASDEKHIATESVANVIGKLKVIEENLLDAC